MDKSDLETSITQITRPLRPLIDIPARRKMIAEERVGYESSYKSMGMSNWGFGGPDACSVEAEAGICHCC